MIDKTAIIKTFRTTLLNGEVVTLISTGQLIAIRDGEYDPLLHVRPADPAKTPIIVDDDLSVTEFAFDRGGKAIYVQETFLPAAELPPANTVDMLAGIMQYSVYVPTKTSKGFAMVTMYNTARYIRELFDPEKPLLSTGESYNVALVMDSADEAPYIKGEAWVSLPVSLMFRSVNIVD